MDHQVLVRRLRYWLWLSSCLGESELMQRNVSYTSLVSQSGWNSVHNVYIGIVWYVCLHVLGRMELYRSRVLELNASDERGIQVWGMYRDFRVLCKLKFLSGG